MTRGRRVLLALSVLALAAPIGASATHSLFDYESAVDALVAVDPTIQPTANDNGKDFVVGGFQGEIFNNSFGFSAHSGPFGEDPYGHLSETIPGVFKGRFRVVCLAVAINEAAIGLVSTASSDEQDTRVVSFRDNPRPTPDQFSVSEEEPPALCALSVGDALFSIQRGNILVHDAMPIP
jgi:hypothetical protein